MTPNLSRIRRVSRLMQRICTLILIAVPLILALVWSNFESLAPLSEAFDKMPIQPDKLTWLTLLLGFLISLAGAAIVLYGVARLRRLFMLYGEGQVFTLETARCIRGFALAIMLYAVSSPVIGGLLSVVLTMGNPPGERALVISFSSNELALLFLGGCLLVISWVMAESSRLADDNAQIV